MRTFGYSAGIVALGALLTLPSVAAAQRHSRHASQAARSSNAASATRPCTSNCGDYSLAVVSALLPTDTGANSEVVTLVIENRGTVAAPLSEIAVAPRDHISLASRSTIHSLAPGERTTVQLPVRSGPSGTECISITINPVPAADPATAQFLASAVEDRQMDDHRSAVPDPVPSLDAGFGYWAPWTDGGSWMAQANPAPFRWLAPFGPFDALTGSSIL